jgi:hypothetical protein
LSPPRACSVLALSDGDGRVHENQTSSTQQARSRDERTLIGEQSIEVAAT